MIYDRLVALNDEWVTDGWRRQLTDETHARRGGVVDEATGVAWPNHLGTPKEMAVWACALVNPDSRHYRNEALRGALEAAADFMLRVQHADGTISPGWTNYHSPPDTAFVVVGLAQVAVLLRRSGLPETAEATRSIETFLTRAGTAMLEGGCHTPNHRWVLAAALAWLHALTGEPAYVRRAEAWLAEGIDITADGEWTERSNGIYNAVSDIMLFHVGTLLGKSELLEPVRSNLRMMTYLVHPDGEIVTEYSGRQDIGNRFNLSNYFMIYQTMAYRDRDSVFAAMAAWAFESVDRPGDLPNQGLLTFLLEPEMKRSTISPAALPDRYDVILNGSYPRDAFLAERRLRGGAAPSHSKLHTEFGAPVARHRNGDTSLTVMTESHSWLSLRYRAIRLLGIRLAASFDPGYVTMQRLALREDDSYMLSAESAKGYYGPLPTDTFNKEAGSQVHPWYLLPHHLRAVTHEQRMTFRATVVPEPDGWTVVIDGSGPEDVLCQLFFLFGDEGRLEGEGLRDAGEGHWLWERGVVRYVHGDAALELTGDFGEHACRTVSHVAIPPQCTAVIANFLAPAKKTVRLRLIEAT
ncbi:hypothetical protein MO973_18345 [Paenibacillus sp. TRM 82003]|nr:hypothetical protein [Paenibacillus sp. TRM 82003]